MIWIRVKRCPGVKLFLTGLSATLVMATLLEKKMKVLLASDGSPNALRAAQWVVALSSEMKTPVTVCLTSVHDDAPYRKAMRHVGRADVLEMLRTQSEEDVAEAKAALESAGITVEYQLEVGEIAETLVKIAEREQCAMMVMGQKGRSTVANLLMGSIATRVLALAQVPVTLVR